jgi:ABC-type branched-subunit amino acid transport system ATPase component
VIQEHLVEEARDRPRAPVLAASGLPYLAIRGVSKSFGEARVLDNVAFDVRRHETTGLIGPNGAGKTTLFNIIAGVERADAGEILLDGRSIAGLPPPALARHGISRTFQEIRLFDGLTALENVMVGFRDNSGERLATAIFSWRATRRGERRARAQAEDLLALVGLDHLADRFPGELSYGQQKRVAIARALATGRDLLCLDEPAAGLDPDAVSDLAALLGRLAAEIGTILLIEHNLELVRDICSHVVFLDNGRIVVEGTPEEVLGDERVWRAFMGL